MTSANCQDVPSQSSRPDAPPSPFKHFSKKIPWSYVVVLILSAMVALIILLTGCASSNVQREASSNVDLGVSNAKNLVDDFTEGDVAESYQNANQRAKGGVIGGTAGALTGLMAGSVGLLPGLAAGAIFGASYGGYIDSNTSLGDQLQNRGANIMEIGDQIMIVLPSARIFQERTAEIKPQAYSTLDLVTKYINNHTNMLVKVAVYTNAFTSPDVDLSLTQSQAQNIVKYLSRTGMNTRLLVAKGEGATHPVEKQSLEWRSSQNYRIEITLEKLHV